MASGDKELEECLMEVGRRLASPPLDADDLFDLLDQTETFLSRVDQSPSKSMFAALRLAMDALVAKDLLEHHNMDVKVAVASCISEITRITAPDAPYDDDLMKAIFQMIVEAFAKLDDLSSRSYSKKISILETVAKVRSCVVMLDLECDALILEMFHHFLKTIRRNHPETVFSSMEVIMTLVVEESEDISSDLLSCLLDSVKKDKEVLYIARRLGEKVISNCAVKLKPYLMRVLSLCSPSEYSKIVASVCRENSDALVQNETDISDEILVDDSKLSERTVSDESPQGSENPEQEVGSPEKVVTPDKSPRSVMSNGAVQRGDENSVVEPVSPKQKPERSRRTSQSKHIVAADRAHSDNLEPSDVKSDSTLGLKTKKTKGRKPNSSNQVTDISEHNLNDGDKEAPSVPSKTECYSKEADNSQAGGPSGEEEASAVSLEPKAKDDLQPHHRSDNGSVSSPTPSDNVPDTGRRKRGRPASSKVSGKRSANAVAVRPASTSGEKEALGHSHIQDESLPSEDNDLKKEHVALSISEEKCDNPGKNVESDTADDAEKIASLTSDSEVKLAEMTVKRGSRSKVKEGDSSGKKYLSNIKQPKGKKTVRKNVAGETLKETPSPRSNTNTQSNDESHLEDNVKAKPRRKRPRAMDEISETPDHKPKLDQSLVGSKIKIWWPDDDRFYDGKVDSFDPDCEKHTIVYSDGDTEVLLLREERYELLEGGSEIEGDQAEDFPCPVASPEVPQYTESKANSGSKKGKKQTPLESGLESSGKHDRSVMKKPRGRPKGWSSTKSKEKSSTKSKDDTPEISGNLKGQSHTPGKKSKVDSGPESSGKLDSSVTKPKGRPKKTVSSTKPKEKSPSNSKDDTPKAGRKTTPKSDESSVGVTSAKGKRKVQASETPAEEAKESASTAKTPEGRVSTGRKRKRKGL